MNELLLLENCRIFNEPEKPNNVLIENGRVVQITPDKLDCENTVDCNGKTLLPGLIDCHVHFRVPGQEHKEDWVSGSRAAVAGGITTVLDMPNNIPSTTNRQLLEEKRAIAARDSKCNFGFFLGATGNNSVEIEQAERIAGVKVFVGSSTGELLVDKDEELKKIFESAKKKNHLIVVHAEHEEEMQKNTDIAKSRFWNHAKYHSKIRTAEAEAIAVERVLEIQGLFGNKLHFAHLSSKVSLDIVKEAKKQGQWVTAEACPHHLFLTEEHTEEMGNFAKINPSLKSKWNAKALWKHLREGTIDVIATDHAPHTVEEKKLSYYDAPSGVPGCQTMLPLLLDAVNRQELSLEKLVQLCCSNPAKIFGIKERSNIAEGNFADLCLVDLNAEQEILNENQHSKCAWTPFHGWKVKGKVLKTFVNGNMVFDEGNFLEARGMEVFSK